MKNSNCWFAKCELYFFAIISDFSVLLFTATDPMENILKMVRNGIKLRPVKHKEDTDSDKTSDTKFSVPSDSHLKLLHDRLNNINKFTRGSSPESDSSDDGEFD